jgi:hypothetical protein
VRVLVGNKNLGKRDDAKILRDSPQVFGGCHGFFSFECADERLAVAVTCQMAQRVRTISKIARLNKPVSQLVDDVAAGTVTTAAAILVIVGLFHARENFIEAVLWDPALTSFERAFAQRRGAVLVALHQNNFAVLASRTIDR